MEQNKITTAQAVEQLSIALKEDLGYWESWKANIAMSIYDGLQFNFLNDESQIVQCVMDRTTAVQKCNEGADRFLRLLTVEKTTEDDKS